MIKGGKDLRVKRERAGGGEGRGESVVLEGNVDIPKLSLMGSL